MTAWWNDLSQREKWLLGLLAGVAGLFLLAQFGVKPLLDWRAQSSLRAQQARDGYEMVTAAAAQGVAESSESIKNQTPLRQALTQSAAAAGIDLVRIGAVVNGQIEVQPEELDGERLFQWLAALQSQYDVTVAFADMSRSSDGLVKAQVLVFERAE
jgi:general secretion pathway protein M